MLLYFKVFCKLGISLEIGISLWLRHGQSSNHFWSCENGEQGVKIALIPKQLMQNFCQAT